MSEIESNIYYINHDPVLGWMNPNGSLTVCHYAEHEMAAKDIVQMNGWFTDWAQEYMVNKTMFGDIF